jgi:hypothetical protein
VAATIRLTMKVSPSNLSGSVKLCDQSTENESNTNWLASSVIRALRQRTRTLLTYSGSTGGVISVLPGALTGIYFSPPLELKRDDSSAKKMMDKKLSGVLLV